MNRFSFLVLALALGLLSTGCGTACKTVDSTPVPYHGGFVDGDRYWTSDWHDTWLDFQGSREYQIYHQLGTDKVLPIPWVAFSAQPMPLNGVGNASLSPGNQSIIQAVNDQFVQVRNDTCEHFYLLMTIERDQTDGAAGAAN